MANLIEFAENELNIILKACKDSESLKLQSVVNEDILSIVKLFSKQGHSGFSAGYCLNAITRLLNYLPLTPLYGTDDEWELVDGGGDVLYQNKRCPAVFKDKDGRTYNVEGKMFSDDGGCSWYTSRDSCVDVEFPYDVPSKPEYIINTENNSNNLEGDK